jgi:proline dehydrogenase
MSSAMRTTLIALSRNRTLQEAIVRVPISRQMARRFVAGERLQDAMSAVLNLNARGMVATLDHLGENVTTEDEALDSTAEYLVALDALYISRAQSNISIKLTQMGLDVGDDLCYENVCRVLARAAEQDNFVRIDMEGSDYTERTLALYRRLRQRFDNVGIVIQSYLRRSRGDVAALIDEGIGHFRLVKGAYDEPAALAFTEREQITLELDELVRMCMTPAALKKGAYCAIATHDSEVINFARAYAYRYDVPRSAFEFQMLYGIRRDLQAQLVQQGYKVRIYVPYGVAWYPYFMRRLAERPANLLFFMRALTGD